MKLRAYDKDNDMFHYFDIYSIWRNAKKKSHVVTDGKCYEIEGMKIEVFVDNEWIACDKLTLS